MLDDTQSLSERLRMEGRGTDWADFAREAADALDQQAAEIELLKEGRKLHDEWADHIEHELATLRATLVEKVDD